MTSSSLAVFSATLTMNSTKTNKVENVAELSARPKVDLTQIRSLIMSGHACNRIASAVQTILHDFNARAEGKPDEIVMQRINSAFLTGHALALALRYNSDSWAPAHL